MAHIAGQGGNCRSSVRAESPASTSGLIEYIQRSNQTIKLLQEELHTTSQFAFKLSDKYEAKRAERDHVASQLSTAKRQCDNYLAQLRLTCEFITQQCKHGSLPDSIAAIVAEHVNFTGTISRPAEQPTNSNSLPQPAAQTNSGQGDAACGEGIPNNCTALPLSAALSSEPAGQEETRCQPVTIRRSNRATVAFQHKGITAAAGSQQAKQLGAADRDNCIQEGRVHAAAVPGSTTQDLKHGIKSARVQPELHLAIAAQPADPHASIGAQQLACQTVKELNVGSAAAANSQASPNMSGHPSPRALAEHAAASSCGPSRAASGPANCSNVHQQQDSSEWCSRPEPTRALQTRRRQQELQRSRPLSPLLESDKTHTKSCRAEHVEIEISSRSASSGSIHVSSIAGHASGGERVVSGDLAEAEAETTCAHQGSSYGGNHLTTAAASIKHSEHPGSECIVTGQLDQTLAAAGVSTSRMSQRPRTSGTESDDSRSSNAVDDSSSNSSGSRGSAHSSSSAGDGDEEAVCSLSSSGEGSDSRPCQDNSNHQHPMGVHCQQGSITATGQAALQHNVIAAQQAKQQLHTQAKAVHINRKSNIAISSSGGSDTEQLSSVPSDRSADLKRSRKLYSASPRSRRSSHSSMYSACSRSTRTSQASLAAAASLVELDNFGLLLEQMSSGNSQQACSGDGSTANIFTQQQALGVKVTTMSADVGGGSSNTLHGGSRRRISATLAEPGDVAKTRDEPPCEAADTQQALSISRGRKVSARAVSSLSAEPASIALGAARASAGAAGECSDMFVSEGGSVFGFVGNAFSNIQAAVAGAGNVRAAAAAVMGALPGSRAGTDGGANIVDCGGQPAGTAATAVQEKLGTPGRAGFGGFTAGTQSSSAAKGGSTHPAGTRRKRSQARHTSAVTRQPGLLEIGMEPQAAAKAEHDILNSKVVQHDNALPQQPAESSTAETPVCVPCPASSASNGKEQLVAVTKQQCDAEPASLARSSSGGRWSSWLGGLAAVGAALSPQRTSSCSCSPSPTGSKASMAKSAAGVVTTQVAYNPASPSQASANNVSKDVEAHSQSAGCRPQKPASDTGGGSEPDDGESSGSDDRMGSASSDEDADVDSDSALESEGSEASKNSATSEDGKWALSSRFDALAEESCSVDDEDEDVDVEDTNSDSN